MPKRIITNCMVGADPEFFCQHEKYGIVSVVDKIGGKKDAPLKLGNKPGFYVQEDNIACEFNIPPTPLISENDDEFPNEMFVQNIRHAIQQIYENHLKKYDLKPIFQSSAIIAENQLHTEQAQTFGCDPDYNAWTKKQNPKPKSKNINLRTTALHFHLSYDNPDEETNCELAKIFDNTAGLFSVLLDKDNQRRILYGKAGSIRHKKYGVEFRILGGNFLSANHINQAFVLLNMAVTLFNKGYRCNYRLVQEAIDSNNYDLARELLILLLGENKFNKFMSLFEEISFNEENYITETNNK